MARDIGFGVVVRLGFGLAAMRPVFTDCCEWREAGTAVISSMAARSFGRKQSSGRRFRDKAVSEIERADGPRVGWWQERRRKAF